MKVSRYLVQVVCLCMFSICSVDAKVVDRTLAIINGEAIMLSEFNKLVSPVMEQFKMVTPAAERSAEKTRELKQKLLDQMIDDKILKQEAKKQKIRVSKRDVEEGVGQVKERFPTEAEFKDELAKEDITPSDFEKRIKEQLMVMKLTEQKIAAMSDKPTEDETRLLFKQIKSKIKGEKLGLDEKEEEDIERLSKFFARASAEQVRARHILVQVDKNATMKEKSAALKKIKEAHKKIKDGTPFLTVVKEYSDDPGSKARGGDLGYFSKGDMVPEFEKTAFSLKVGGMSEPVSTDFGYHIIKVEEKRAGRELAYEEVEADLQKYLYQKSAQKKYEKWIGELRAKAAIKINEIE